MSESTLSLKYSDLLSEVGAFLGYGVDPSAWSAEKLAEVDRYVQAGVRQFYYPPAVQGVEAAYEWSFLNPTTTIVTADADSEQDLPDALGRILGDLYFAPSVHSSSIVVVSEARMLSLRQSSADKGRPCFAAVRAKAGTALTSGQRNEIMWWPTPNAAYTLTYRYEAYSGKLTSLLPYPLGGMRYAELITESCLSVAEQRGNDERGLHYERFVSLLASGIAMDRKAGARHFGHMGGEVDESVAPRRHSQASYDVTYKGSTW